MTVDGREHLLDDVAALQSLDGKRYFPEAALGRISSSVTSGQEVSLAERETCVTVRPVYVQEQSVGNEGTGDNVSTKPTGQD